MSEQTPTHLNTLFAPPSEEAPTTVQQTEEQTPTAPTQEEAKTADPVIGAYMNFLKDNGLVEIPEDLEVNEDPATLQNIFEYTKTKRQKDAATDLLNSLPPTFKPVLEYVLSGGEDVNGFVKKYVQNPIDTLDLNDPNDQRKAIYLALRETSSYPDEKIKRIVDRIAEDPLELANEANESYRELSALMDTRRQQEIQRVEQLEQQERQIAQQRTQSLISAIEDASVVHPQRRGKIRSFLFDNIQTQEGPTTGFNRAISAILSNPAHQAQLADILLDYDPTKGFSSEKETRRAASSGVKKFEESLRATLDPKSAQTSGSATPITPTAKSLQDIDWSRF